MSFYPRSDGSEFNLVELELSTAWSSRGDDLEACRGPVPNGQLPSELGLPAQISMVENRKLKGKDLERYYLGYHRHEDELPSAEDMREGIIKAMAVGYSLKDERIYEECQQARKRVWLNLENRPETLE